MINPRNIALATLLATSLALSAQVEISSDSAVIDRTVYVEREFQPTIQSAGKIAVKPSVYEPEITVGTPVYSEYSQPLSIDYNVHQVDYAGLNFRHPEPLHGFMQAGVGHVNSLFEFNYRVTDSQMQGRGKTKANDLVLDIHADHLGQWGRKTLSETKFGMDFSKQFSKVEFFFGAQGGNDFFTRYGAYYDTLAPSTLSIDKISQIDAKYRQQVWTVDTRLGIRNIPNAPVKYNLQMGYESFVVPDYAIEHQVHTAGMFEWDRNFHHVGVDLDMQNRFYSVTDTALVTRSNTFLHLEPYYAWLGKRLRVHAGINMDISAGHGRVAGISPNVELEADLTKNWLAVYAIATGHYEGNGARGEYRENRYRAMSCLFGDSISGAYTPLDATVGFKIRPYSTLLLDIHAGYRITLDEHVNVFGKEAYGYFEHQAQNVQIWTLGANLHYHWRDIVSLNVGGHYGFHSAMKKEGLLSTIEGYTDKATHPELFEENGKAIIFDAAEWQVRARLDVNINRKWSIYSDNILMGSRHACVYDATVATYTVAKLRPMFDLNLGLQYNVNKWVSVYAQLSNYLAWTKNLSYMTFYGYEAQRANCMFGLSWSF